MFSHLRHQVGSVPYHFPVSPHCSFSMTCLITCCLITSHSPHNTPAPYLFTNRLGKPITYSRVHYSGTPEIWQQITQTPSRVSTPDPITPQGLCKEEELFNQQEWLREEIKNLPPPAPVFHQPNCTFGHPYKHPHQFLTFFTSQGEEWCSIQEFGLRDTSLIIPVHQLLTSQQVFPGVTPFHTKNPHFFALYPVSQARARQIGVPPLYVCSKAIQVHPSAQIPLGSIKYNFREGIGVAFTHIPQLARQVYQGKLVILEVHDFLDGRVVSTYGHLKFTQQLGQEIVLVVDQFYHFEDKVRKSPVLLNYTFSPRIPADPFLFILTYHDEEPC